MTRILVLSNMYPPHHLGGYELSCRDVMDRLRARGHDITILTTTLRLPDVDAEPRADAQGVRRELSFYWDDHRILNPPLWRRVAMERANQSALGRAIAETRPEVVSAWNMGAMSMGLLTSVIEARLPLVLSICDEWPIYGPRVDAWTRLFLGRPRLGWAARRFTGVPTTLADLGRHAAFLYISHTIRRKVEEASPWRPRIASVVYNGIDPDDFPPAPAGGERPWRWRLLYAGRVDERKGIHVAVEALARLPATTTLEIDGRGDRAYIARLRDLSRRLGVDARVRFATTPRRTLKDRYRDADVVVFPTLWDEPFGLVPVEAMACRTPVVATGTGGSGEFLVDGMNCLLVPPGDAAAVTVAVERLSADASLRDRLAEGGLRTAAELTVDRFADEMEAWHTAAAGGFASGLPAQRQLAIA